MMKILMSSRTAASLETRVAHVLGERPHVILKAEETVAGTAIDLAFLSRDVTGASTKRNTLLPTQRFYDLLFLAPGLSWVHIHSSGADRPVYAELRSKGITVTTSSGANARPVAHTVLAGLLTLARNFPRFAAAQRERRWDQRLASGPPRDLHAQTAIIVGWGPVAQEVARLLAAIGMHCVAVRRKSGEPGAPGVRMISFAELPANLGHADWLILACPLTELTRALVNRASLALLPQGARLINVARGEVVVQPDLIEALQTGQLAGAYLDVTDPEPLPPDSPLWAMENVILTPHTAGHADTNEERVASMFLENLRRWRDGSALQNQIP